VEIGRSIFKKSMEEPSTPARLIHSALALAKSELRVLIFVWSLTVSYLISSRLQPDRLTLLLLPSAGYLLVLGVYILSDIADIEDDRINSPKRPLVSGKVNKGDAQKIALVSIGSSFFISEFVSDATLILFAVFLLLGLSYSIPRVNVKKRFPLKAVVPAAGAAVMSLAGGAAAEGLKPVIFLAAVSFSLFALVTLLLGDISDVKGDLATGVRSFPVVIGARNSVLVVMAIPLVLSVLGVLLFRILQLNLAFPTLLIATSLYCCATMRPLIADYDDPLVCRRVKARMRIVHFVIQFIFILGILQL
jgi:geranylgeranylglycerol-phosphate geranylgeranyltransferase